MINTTKLPPAQKQPDGTFMVGLQERDLSESQQAEETITLSQESWAHDQIWPARFTFSPAPREVNAYTHAVFLQITIKYEWQDTKSVPHTSTTKQLLHVLPGAPLPSFYLRLVADTSSSRQVALQMLPHD